MTSSSHRILVVDDRWRTVLLALLPAGLFVAMVFAWITGARGKSGTATRWDWALGALVWGVLSVPGFFAGRRVELTEKGVSVTARGRTRHRLWSEVRGLRLRTTTVRERARYTLAITSLDGGEDEVTVPAERLDELLDFTVKHSPHIVEVE